MISAQTGISIGNLHSMRRATATAIVDKRNELREGYLPISKILESQDGKSQFMNDLQNKILRGYENITGESVGAIPPAEDVKQISGNK